MHSTYVTTEKESFFGKYMGIDQAKLDAAPDADKAAVATIQGEAKKSALKTVAILPVIMLLCYIGLLFYFKGRGGYKAEQIGAH